MHRPDINYVNAHEVKAAAHRWIDKYFLIVPGRQKVNFRIREYTRDLRFGCNHGSYGTAAALQHLVNHWGGYEQIITEEMRREAERCLAATRSIEAAVELICRRYSVWEGRSEELMFQCRQRPWLHGRYRVEALASATNLPEVQILAGIFGPRLGPHLLEEVRTDRLLG